jgi:exosome complex component RRP41
MRNYVVACTAGSTSSYSSNDEKADPLLDLNGLEEQELPFLTVATLGASDRVCVLVMETRVQVGRLEGMLAVGVDGCKQVRSILDGVVRRQGKKILDGVVG